MSAPEPLVTFHGPVRIVEQALPGCERMYLVTPLSQAAIVEALCVQRERAAWYAGVDAVMQLVEAEPQQHVQLRAAIAALRAPGDVGR